MTAPPDLQPNLDPTIRHLYVHVPFCPSICPYCDFHVLTRSAGQVEAYLARLEEQAAELAGTYQIDLETVYLGGGTPSFLRSAELTQLTHSIRRHLGWGKVENTLEVNPGTLSPARATHWRGLGFDRASLGVQSLHDPTLKFLGRQHDAAQARDAARQLISAGFRVSGDLITAVPGQPLEADIAGLVELEVEHISAYTLTIEPGTEFARRGVTVAEADELRGFARSAELLSGYGFGRYEISNYARPGAESRHNLAYWHNRFYLGLGPGAAGHYPARDALAERITNPRLPGWLSGEPGEKDVIGPEDYATDALFMGLRLAGGVNLSDLSQRSGLNLRERYGAVIRQQAELGLLDLQGDTLRATEQGWWVLNRVVTAFLEA